MIIHPGLMENIIHPHLSTENTISKEIKCKNKNV